MKLPFATLAVSRVFLALALGTPGMSMAQAAGAEQDYIYTVTKGDTLIGLTSRLLNSPSDWPKVARLNRLPNANFIAPGATLRVPFSLLKTTRVTATVTHVEGDVKAVTTAAGAAAPLTLGASLAEGAEVITGKNGYVTLKLHDGSTVRVQSASQMQVERSRTYSGVGLFESAMKLISGRVESLVQKFQPGDKTQTRNAVKTPLATLAVRGTEFRVTMDGQTNQTRGEVLEGEVAVDAGGAGGVGGVGEKRLNAGFGGVVDSAKTVSDPIMLLAAPDVSKLPKLQERPLLRFTLPALDGARAYRAGWRRSSAPRLRSALRVMRGSSMPRFSAIRSRPRPRRSKSIRGWPNFEP